MLLLNGKTKIKNGKIKSKKKLCGSGMLSYGLENNMLDDMSNVEKLKKDLNKMSFNNISKMPLNKNKEKSKYIRF